MSEQPPSNVSGSSSSLQSSFTMSSEMGHMQAPSWQHRVSASFAAMAEQVQAASQAVAMIPAMSAVAHESTLVEVIARLESIERQQDRLHEEFNELKALVQQTREGPERFEKRLDDQIKAFNLDQQRLPARLHNATASKGPNPIKAPPTASGKTPKNFPNTKGEFEHLTRERYETIMVEYGIPISGDITAKRDTLRSFLGIPA